MKLLNIGGATAILEHKGKRILFDPWLNEGILHGSWYHYPPLNMGLSDIGHLDYIYISHIHEDHCAPGTIRHLNRDAEIIVMDREPRIRNFVMKFLKNHGFQFKKIHLVNPNTPLEIEPGMIADMVEAPEDNEYNYLVDSGLILRWDGFTLYNANDCPPHPKGLEYIRKTYGQPDLALLPYAGGSGYPNCYTNLSHEEKMKEKARIHEMGLKMFTDAVEAVDPVWVMPFADQYVIAGSRSNLNKYSPHPVSPGEVLETAKKHGFESRLLLLNSAQSFDFGTKKKTPDELYRHFSEADREAYIRTELLDKKYDHEKLELSDSVPLERLLGQARKRLWLAQEKQGYFPDFSYYLHVTDREKTFRVNMKDPAVREIPASEAPQKPYLKISGTSTLFNLLLIAHISWNMADGAFFLDWERVPNVYEPKIHAILNHLTV